jgi:hypothetical protein
MPISTLPESYLQLWKEFSVKYPYVMTFVQWYPFHVPGPFAYKEGNASSELAVANDALYRVKPSIDHYLKNNYIINSKVSFSEVLDKVWLSHINLDDFLVVHPNFPSMKHQLDAYPIVTTASLRFDNSYFYMIKSTTTLQPPSAAHLRMRGLHSDGRRLNLSRGTRPMQQEQKDSKHPKYEITTTPLNNMTLASLVVKDEYDHEIFNISGQLLPLGFSWEDFQSATIIHERNLQLFWSRTKLIVNTNIVLAYGGHGVDLVTLLSCHEQSSFSFYLHFIKASRGRGIDIIQRPTISSLKSLLSLPRKSGRDQYKQSKNLIYLDENNRSTEIFENDGFASWSLASHSKSLFIKFYDLFSGKVVKMGPQQQAQPPHSNTDSHSPPPLSHEAKARHEPTMNHASLNHNSLERESHHKHLIITGKGRRPHQSSDAQ